MKAWERLGVTEETWRLYLGCTGANARPGPEWTPEEREACRVVQRAYRQRQEGGYESNRTASEVRNAAVTRLVEAHREEFDRYQAEERAILDQEDLDQRQDALEG